MVSAARKGENVKLGPAPAAIATIIVSPIARDMATINAAATPERAAGNTIRTAVSNFVAPKAYEACRSEFGTAFSASSLIELTKGITRMPMTMPAEAVL